MSVDQTQFALTRLEEQAARNGHVLYAVLKRAAGWGVHWYVEGRVPAHDRTVTPQVAPSGFREIPPNWQQGLVVYDYHPTFDAMLFAEFQRFNDMERA